MVAALQLHLRRDDGRLASSLSLLCLLCRPVRSSLDPRGSPVDVARLRWPVVRGAGHQPCTLPLFEVVPPLDNCLCVLLLLLLLLLLVLPSSLLLLCPTARVAASMSSPPVPLYDLSRLSSVYPEPSTLRAAYVSLARWAHKAERWEDMARVMREVVRAATQGLLGPTPQPNATVLMRITGVEPPLPPHPHSALFAGVGASIAGVGGSGSALVDPHDLSGEERVLLYLSYKQLVTSLRQSWRAIQGEELQAGSKEAKLVDEYRHQLERELSIVCTDLTQLLDTSLIATVTSAEGKVFYLKMAADFYRSNTTPHPLTPPRHAALLISIIPPSSALYRYLAEVSGGVTGLTHPALVAPHHSVAAAGAVPPPPSSSSIVPAGYDKKALEYYAAAHKIALTALDPTHPTRLGLCLNYSVLLFEVLREKKQACELARQSFDAAIGRLDEVEESMYKESTLLMQLLRDNLSLWTSHEQEAQ